MTAVSVEALRRLAEEYVAAEPGRSGVRGWWRAPLLAAAPAAINDQINAELESAYLYLSMSAWCASKNMGGAAKWMGMQAREEQEHALKLYEHVLDRGGKVTLQAIAQPRSDWGSLQELFQQVAEHEAHVTALITRLYEVACKENDYPAQIMLQWFITEQVEEEKNASDIIAQLDLIEAKGTAVLMLDKTLGKRGGDVALGHADERVEQVGGPPHQQLPPQVLG